MPVTRSESVAKRSPFRSIHLELVGADYADTLSEWPIPTGCYLGFPSSLLARREAIRSTRKPNAASNRSVGSPLEKLTSWLSGNSLANRYAIRSTCFAGSGCWLCQTTMPEAALDLLAATMSQALLTCSARTVFQFKLIRFPVSKWGYLRPTELASLLRCSTHSTASRRAHPAVRSFLRGSMPA